MASRKSKKSLFLPAVARTSRKSVDGRSSFSRQSQPSTSIEPPVETNEDRDKIKNRMTEDEKIEMLEKAAAKKKAKQLQDHLEKIEYNQFPTILGWYFDGSFTANFNLNDEFAEYFSELEDEQEAKRDLDIEETFTEKVNRNFWPPKFFGHFFRTRGVYLDFKETKEDPPKTPPEMNFERHHATIGIGLNDDGDDGDGGGSKIQFGNVEYASASGRRANDKRDFYYWTDETREFLPKDEDDEYEWSNEDKVWRKSYPSDRNPYSWYWNQSEGRYCIRDKSKRDDYIFDQPANIYRRKGMEGMRSKNGLGPHDYFYCENTQKWIPISEAVSGETEVYANGKREIKKGPRGVTGLGPDDYYYSGESGRMENKTNDLHEYYYDTKDEMFKRYAEGYGPGKTGLFATDYKFSNTAGEWLPKNPKELYKPSPYDWYFDVEKGRFFKLDKTQRDDYEFDQVANVWKMKGLKGPSANDLGPEDYVFDETNGTWRLENSFEPPEVVEKHEPGKRKIRKGLRGKSGKLPDDFYYDSLLGEFVAKDSTRLANYFYDPVDEVFRKQAQPYGPGKSKLLPSQFYFDGMEGQWQQTSEAKTITARNMQTTPTKLLAQIFRSPYDFAFDAHSGTFVPRDEVRQNDYEYNAETAVFFRKGISGPSINGKKVGDYYFDEHLYEWLPLESPKGHEARDYKNGRRNNRVGPRGKSGKIPDDFYFSEGKFLDKDRTHPELYTFHPELGIWKLVTTSPIDSTPGNGLNIPSDYYFSYEDGEFILKKDLKYGEIVLDRNSKLWIQKLRIPMDYMWDGRNYVLKAATKTKVQMHPTGDTVNAQNVAGAVMGQRQEHRLTTGDIDYDKPWLQNYPHLAADKKRFIQEIDKVNKKRGTSHDAKIKGATNTTTKSHNNPAKPQGTVSKFVQEIENVKTPEITHDIEIQSSTVTETTDQQDSIKPNAEPHKKKTKKASGSKRKKVEKH